MRNTMNAFSMSQFLDERRRNSSMSADSPSRLARESPKVGYSPVRRTGSGGGTWPLDTSAEPVVHSYQMETFAADAAEPKDATNAVAVERSTRRVPHEPLRRLNRPGGMPASFGALRFAQVKRAAAAKWACVSADSQPQDVLELLLTTWKLRRPEVLISVTGAAAGSPPMDTKQQLVFRRGLLKAARRTRVWIVTGGTNAGVMAMVGRTVQEASEDQPVVCLGVASWGALLGHERMELKGNGKVFVRRATNPTNKWLAVVLHLYSHLLHH